MAKKKVGVIGGGIVGTSVAYNLSLYDFIDVTLFEKDQIGSGTTAKSAGTVCLFDDSIPHEFWESACTVSRPISNGKRRARLSRFR